MIVSNVCVEAGWLVRSKDLVRALAVDIVLCSWARLYFHSASLHPDKQMDTVEFNAVGNPAMD